MARTVSLDNRPDPLWSGEFQRSVIKNTGRIYNEIVDIQRRVFYNTDTQVILERCSASDLLNLLCKAFHALSPNPLGFGRVVKPIHRNQKEGSICGVG